MAIDVVMPKLGLTMESGVIGSWLVKEGDSVSKGQPLLEVITDKVTMEVEAQAEGTVRKIFYPEGSEIEVSKRIAIIGSVDEKIDDENEVEVKEAIDSKIKASTVLIEKCTHPEKNKFRKRISPKARKIASQNNLNIDLIDGSGANGRVISIDVESYLAKNAGQSPERTSSNRNNFLSEEKAFPSGSSVELLPAEKVASHRLTASYQQAPHIHLSLDVSAIWLEQIRNGYKLEGKKISHSSLILRGIALALEEFPRVNSHYCEGGFIPQGQIDIGLAVAVEDGLTVPVIRNANQLNIEEISIVSNKLIDKARHSRLLPDDCVGGSFTISNLGMMGVNQFTAIINPPQVAIMAVGAIQKRVVNVGDDGFALRPQLTLTLGADHRVLDGAISARFLGRVKEILETPGLLV